MIKKPSIVQGLPSTKSSSSPSKRSLFHSHKSSITDSLFDSMKSSPRINLISPSTLSSVLSPRSRHLSKASTKEQHDLLYILSPTASTQPSSINPKMTSKHGSSKSIPSLINDLEFLKQKVLKAQDCFHQEPRSFQPHYSSTDLSARTERNLTKRTINNSEKFQSRMPETGRGLNSDYQQKPSLNKEITVRESLQRPIDYTSDKPKKPQIPDFSLAIMADLQLSGKPKPSVAQLSEKRADEKEIVGDQKRLKTKRSLSIGVNIFWKNSDTRAHMAQTASNISSQNHTSPSPRRGVPNTAVSPKSETKNRFINLIKDQQEQYLSLVVSSRPKMTDKGDCKPTQQNGLKAMTSHVRISSQDLSTAANMSSCKKITNPGLQTESPLKFTNMNSVNTLRDIPSARVIINNGPSSVRSNHSPTLYNFDEKAPVEAVARKEGSLKGFTLQRVPSLIDRRSYGDRRTVDLDFNPGIGKPQFEGRKIEEKEEEDGGTVKPIQQRNMLQCKIDCLY